MKQKEYYFVLNDTLYGPCTAEEIQRLNLASNTPMTDNIKGEKWGTAYSFGFGEKPNGSARKSFRMEGTTYLFIFKQNGKEHGPRTAKQMLKLNLPPETPVTESSLNGEWFVAGNFDFKALCEEEEGVGNDEIETPQRQHRTSLRDVVAGLILMIVGIVVTSISYNNASGGGTYIVAFGAIIGGFIQFLKGLTGEVDKRTYYYYEDHGSGNTDTQSQVDVKNLPSEKMNELFATLELTPAASNDEVRKAYRTLAKRYHPDRHTESSEQDREFATIRFRNIYEAYETIKQIRNMK